MDIATLRRLLSHHRSSALAILCVLGVVSIAVGGALAAPGTSRSPTPTGTSTSTPTPTAADSNGRSQSNGDSPSNGGSQSGDAAGSQQATTSETMGTVTLIFQDGAYLELPFVSKEYNFKVTVTKLNRSTFVVAHHHGTTSKRWYIANTSLSKTNKHAGWPGRIGKHTSKKRLANQIADTKIYKQQIRPFMKSDTHRTKKSLVDQPGKKVGFDPVKNLKKIVTALFGFGKGIITTTLDWIFGVPAPGKPTKPQTWLNPHNGIWGGIADFTKWTTTFAALLLAYSGGMTFLRTDATKRRQDWKRWGFALVMVLGTWTLLPLGLHLANEFSQVVRPDLSGIFRSWASVSKVGVGLGFMIILAFLQQSILGIGIFVLAIERVIILITVGFWPLAWALRSTRNDIAQSLGQLCVFLLAMMIATKLGQALMARLLFSLEWNLGSAGLGHIVIMLLVIGAGTAFMLIYFPFKMLQHANDAANVSLGMSTAAKASGQASEWAGDRASERVRPYLKGKYDSLRDWRENEPASAIPDHKQQVGQVGRGRDDPERTDYSQSTSSDGGFDGFDPEHFNRYEKHDPFDTEASNRYQEHVDDLNMGTDDE
jgi:hypothetical protein